MIGVRRTLFYAKMKWRYWDWWFACARRRIHVTMRVKCEGVNNPVRDCPCGGTCWCHALF